jgi:predicted CXXCH cytochrome family protein
MFSSSLTLLSPPKGIKRPWPAIVAPALFVLCCLAASAAQAKVSGSCSNCHTMHNSQNGGATVTSGNGSTLLVADCVGCHSSNTAETVIDGTPIVFNAVPPTNPLAGGNFYWVSQGGSANDVFGHNVWGISGVDNNITPTEGAPGRNGGPGCANSCHNSLALSPTLSSFGKNGCQGCHTEVAHHNDDKPWFRFLKGHMHDDAYAIGIEAPGWEQNAATDPADRNIYLGADAATLDYSWGTGLRTVHTTSAFCAGCHADFHEEMGVASPWLRHPNDILLPTSGEYGAYDPVTSYSNEAPVAYLNINAPTRAEAVVSCLSCHRAHGSDQPDMLRWDYTNMAAGTGCYVCHTTKD